jgi:TRAP-type uncharacterized transport system substrate-binding protein
MRVPRILEHPHRGWGLALLALLAFILAGVMYVRREWTTAPVRVTITSGIAEGQRTETLARFVALAVPHGLYLRPVETRSSTEALEKVNSGAIDLAVVQGGMDFSPYPNIRQITAVQVLPLHLLVKEEHADAVSAHLGALRGKTVNLGGGERSGTYWLADEVLAFAGLERGRTGLAGDYRASGMTTLELAAIDDRARLPDAIFLVAPLPAAVVGQLVTERGYRLVALPFRDAFTLGAVSDAMEGRSHAHDPTGASSPAPKSSAHPVILRENVIDTVIPAFTYQADPGVPPAPLHTLGMKALLIANHKVEPEAVYRVLEVLFQTRYAKIVQPTLDYHRLEEIPEVPWHSGSVTYLERSKPVLTGEFVSELVNLVSIAGPLGGGVLFLWQWMRQRGRLRSEASFEAYIAKVSALEQRALELEQMPAASLDHAELGRLWRALGELKVEALGKFARGEMTGETVLTSFLTHVNDARAHLTHLLEGRPGDRALR